MYFFCVSYNYL